MELADVITVLESVKSVGLPGRLEIPEVSISVLSQKAVCRQNSFLFREITLLSLKNSIWLDEDHLLYRE